MDIPATNAALLMWRQALSRVVKATGLIATYSNNKEIVRGPDVSRPEKDFACGGRTFDTSAPGG
jgi:hypothetical protein